MVYENAKAVTKWEIEYEVSNRRPGFWENNSKGRADVIIETDNNIFIFEFKLDGSAKEALEQIFQAPAEPLKNG